MDQPLVSSAAIETQMVKCFDQLQRCQAESKIDKLEDQEVDEQTRPQEGRTQASQSSGVEHGLVKVSA